MSIHRDIQAHIPFWYRRLRFENRVLVYGMKLSAQIATGLSSVAGWFIDRATEYTNWAKARVERNFKRMDEFVDALEKELRQ